MLLCAQHGSDEEFGRAYHLAVDRLNLDRTRIKNSRQIGAPGPVPEMRRAVTVRSAEPGYDEARAPPRLRGTRPGAFSPVRAKTPREATRRGTLAQKINVPMSPRTAPPMPPHPRGQAASATRAAKIHVPPCGKIKPAELPDLNLGRVFEMQ